MNRTITQGDTQDKFFLRIDTCGFVDSIVLVFVGCVNAVTIIL